MSVYDLFSLILHIQCPIVLTKNIGHFESIDNKLRVSKLPHILSRSQYRCGFYFVLLGSMISKPMQPQILFSLMALKDLNRPMIYVHKGVSKIMARQCLPFQHSLLGSLIRTQLRYCLCWSKHRQYSIIRHYQRAQQRIQQRQALSCHYLTKTLG